MGRGGTIDQASGQTLLYGRTPRGNGPRPIERSFDEQWLSQGLPSTWQMGNDCQCLTHQQTPCRCQQTFHQLLTSPWMRTTDSSTIFMLGIGNLPNDAWRQHNWWVVLKVTETENDIDDSCSDSECLIATRNSARALVCLASHWHDAQGRPDEPWRSPDPQAFVASHPVQLINGSGGR
jgi:hypothetical protein